MSNQDHSDSSERVEVSSLQPGWLVGDGRYTLIRILARGGMGVIWLARDEQLREEVALKFLPPEICHDAIALEGLRHETARARKLAHPNIVGIFDFFKNREEAFISMEFVEGLNLGELRLHQPHGVFAWDHLQPLVMQLCAALDYAHNEGVIHRDIKPANLIFDRKGRLKLADFGLSVQVMDRLDHVSHCHARSGTVNYMSPQQMDGGPAHVTDDIYALGAMLFELLTSQPPFFDGDIAHQVKNRLAPSLRERLVEVGIENEVPPAVAALIMACLAKDPAQRPQSARSVADWIALPEARPRTEPQRPPSTSPATSPKLSHSQPAVTPAASIRPSAGRKDPVRRLSLDASSPWFWAGAAAVVLAILLIIAGLIAWLRSPPELAGEVLGQMPVEADSQSAELAPIADAAQSAARELTFAAHSSEISGLAVFGDGDFIASSSLDDTIRISNGLNGTPVWIRPAGQRGVRAISISSDERLLASGGFDGSIRLWTLENGAPEKMLSGHRAAVSQVSFRADGDYLASADDRGGIVLWNYQTGEPLKGWRAHEGPVHALAFSPDGEWLASAGGNDFEVRLWAFPEGRPGPVLSSHDQALHSIAFSPDGKWLASTSHDKSLCIWNSLTWKLERRVQYRTRSNEMLPVTFSPDSRFVVTGKPAGETTLFEVRTASTSAGRDISRRAAGGGDIRALVFAPDGSSIIAGDSQGKLRILPFEPERIFLGWK